MTDNWNWQVMESSEQGVWTPAHTRSADRRRGHWQIVIGPNPRFLLHWWCRWAVCVTVAVVIVVAVMS